MDLVLLGGLNNQEGRGVLSRVETERREPEGRARRHTCEAAPALSQRATTEGQRPEGERGEGRGRKEGRGV